MVGGVPVRDVPDADGQADVPALLPVGDVLRPLTQPGVAVGVDLLLGVGEDRHPEDLVGVVGRQGTGDGPVRDRPRPSGRVRGVEEGALDGPAGPGERVDAGPSDGELVAARPLQLVDRDRAAGCGGGRAVDRLAVGPVAGRLGSPLGLGVRHVAVVGPRAVADDRHAPRSGLRRREGDEPAVLGAGLLRRGGGRAGRGGDEG